MLIGLHRQNDAMEDVFVVDYVDNNIPVLARMVRSDAWAIGRSAIWSSNDRALWDVMRPLQRHPSQQDA
jgi:hypothetical protein